MKCIWCSRTFWFNAITLIVGAAAYITQTFSPDVFTDLGIPVVYVNEGLKVLSGIVTLGNIYLRTQTSLPLTFKLPEKKPEDITPGKP